MILADYKNGNANIKLYSDGTRETFFENELKLDYPLNVDIRVSTSCFFGLNERTGKSVCSFCHESALVKGRECDYNKLKENISPLIRGMELAIGGNEITEGLQDFLYWSSGQGFIPNLTVNQGHLSKAKEKLVALSDSHAVYGFGISYRSGFRWNVDPWFLENPNVLFHVIAGIDSIEDVLALSKLGVKKILILGEKDFGFNKGAVDLESRKHREWFWWVGKLFDAFQVVSFDNLALEQLDIKRFFSESSWDTFYQGEYSFYINAVDGFYSPSSRSTEKVSWGAISAPNYFKQLFPQGGN